MYGSDFGEFKLLLQQAEKCQTNCQQDLETIKDQPELIFIFGMPRSGKTLLESILSRNDLFLPCGENHVYVTWNI